ncbi:RNA polymerase sigma-70 factor, ECF subfamily [Sphingomonas laterariae]|uniref:RNA polymerase sigma-70 factor, ECF subfamily n=2 Tax=Edaphosphingomonas laterariae TaxID=861865 RepID=A0A239G0V7_9SPHN|nr:RNA polymerase sigma-70 factor, ECF subfamily [Sphingomonas laterariae]
MPWPESAFQHSLTARFGADRPCHPASEMSVRDRPIDEVGERGGEAIRLRAALKRYVARRVPAGDVDDVLQDVFLNLAKAEPQYSIGNLSAYVFRIASNLVLARGRRPAWYAPVGEASGELADDRAFPPDRVLASKQELRSVMHDIMALPERTRDVFLLHRFEDFTYAEIAGHFDISLSAVEKHMIKALRRLSHAANAR